MTAGGISSGGQAGDGRGAPSKPRVRFAGEQTIATVDAIDAFVRSAQAGCEFTYCEAAEPIRIDAWHRARELEQSGLVHLRQERRAGGGYRWSVVRTKKALGPARSAADKALGDRVTAAIFAELKRAANLGLACPTDSDLADRLGMTGRPQAQWRVRALVQAGLIESSQVTENNVPRRVVTICDTRHAGAAAGKRTALPPKSAALERAYRRDASAQAGDGGSSAGARASAAPNFPRSRRGAL